MHFILWLTLLFLPNSLPQGIILGGVSSSNTFTLVQNLGNFCSSSTTCAVTVSSTGSGHLLFLQAGNSSGAADYLSSVSGGGTWVVPSSCQINDSSTGAVSCAYSLSSSSGTTTVNLTFGASSAYSVAFWEYSFTLGSTSLDTCGTGDNTTAATTQSGVALTLSGSSDVLLQATTGNTTIGGPTSISSPYGHLTGPSIPLQFFGGADSENSSSGTAPTWTWSASNKSVVNACAFK